MQHDTTIGINSADLEKEHSHPEKLTPLKKSEQVNTLIIGGESHNDLFNSYLIPNEFNLVRTKSFSQAQNLVEKRYFPLIILEENIPYSKMTGSQFVISIDSVLKKTKLVILIAINEEVTPEMEKIQKLGIRIVTSRTQLETVLENVFDNYKQSDFDDFNKIQNNKPSSSSSEQNSAQSQPFFDEGISPHIASDLWTTEDALGYEDYAYAIFKFMTHPKTQPPLTISIQAPWGGGKTSLMRMIRKFIDPDADNKLKEAAQQPNGKLKLKEAIAEIKEWIDDNANRKPFETEDKEILKAENQEAKKLTIWFNAWKYENTNQVWAGLIDTVMQQVAGRLPVKERELFWLRLNLKRVDTDKIRKKIHDRIFNYFLKGIWYWGIGLILVSLPTVLIALGQQLQLFGFTFSNIGSGISFSTFGTLLLSVGKYIHAKYKVDEEPAVVSLNDYLEIPNYSSEIGFIHRAEIDLKHVLESIPDQYKPLVIFIDDLDRCSPTKISQVVEAVNLFLAGDFPHCFFVIGMDTEMVAAALQSAHKDMIANLPSDLGIPVGWRFMDKFVQLPFLIPPCQRFTKNYVDSLFNLNQPNAEQVSAETQKKIADLIQAEINQNTPINLVESKTNTLLSENRINNTEAAYFRRNLQSILKKTMIDRGVKSFTDKYNEIRELMETEKAFDHFTGNPRELKRFINAFRFNYFLWWAQKSQDSEVVTIKQLLRWTILSMKWAEVIRWLRRGDGSDWVTTLPENTDTSKVELVARLKLLEEISQKNTKFQKWKEELSTRFQLDLKTTNWLNDEDLFRFYRKESDFLEKERLSNGFGKGIW